MNEILLQVQDLKVHYPIKKDTILGHDRVLKAVDGVTFDVWKGETFGIVGESGCGKTTTGKAVVKLTTATGGTVLYNGHDIYAKAKKDEQLAYRRKLQMIFQDPFSSLDPRFTVGRTIAEPMEIHHIGSKAERKERVYELMNEVGLKREQYTRFPHEFSGGQRQRVGIARALSLQPELIVCDEPVSALDVSIQAQILNLMKDLQEKYSLTYIFISHNLSVVKHICNRIGVMYLGNFVELAGNDELFDHPLHPYTQGLLDAIPILDPEHISIGAGLEGDVPSPMSPPSGCVFHTRCKYCTERCKQERPEFKEACPGHFVACHLANDMG